MPENYEQLIRICHGVFAYGGLMALIFCTTALLLFVSLKIPRVYSELFGRVAQKVAKVSLPAEKSSFGRTSQKNDTCTVVNTDRCDGGAEKTVAMNAAAASEADSDFIVLRSVMEVHTNKMISVITGFLAGCMALVLTAVWQQPVLAAEAVVQTGSESAESEGEDLQSEDFESEDETVQDKLKQSFTVIHDLSAEMVYGETYVIKLDHISGDPLAPDLVTPFSQFEVTVDGQECSEFISVMKETEQEYRLSVLRGGGENINIQIKQPANDYYDESVWSFMIHTIKARELSLSAEPAEKIYDGEDTVIIEAVLNMDDIVPADQLIAEKIKNLTAVGKLDDVNAALAQTAAAVFSLPEMLGGKYILKNGGVVTVSAKVSRAPLIVKVEDMALDYTKVMSGAEIPLPAVVVEGWASKDALMPPQDFILPQIYIDITLLDPLEIKVGGKYDVFKLQGGNAADNYFFDFDNFEIGTLKLLPEGAKAEDVLILAEEESTNAVMGSDGIIWFGPDKQTAARFKITDKKYEKIYLCDAENIRMADVTLDGICPHDYITQESAVQDLYVYLASDDSERLRTDKIAIKFALDKQAPSGEICVDGFTGANHQKSFVWSDFFAENEHSDWFGQDGMSALITAADGASGIRSISYYLHQIRAEKFTLLDVHTLTEDQWTICTGKIDLSPDYDYVIYARATDKAGNTGYFSTARFTSDTEKPEGVKLEIFPRLPAENKGIYSESDHPGFNVVVKDQKNGGSYAGLKRVVCKIENMENGIVCEDVKDFAAAEHRQIYEAYDILIDPVKFSGNHICITVTVTDWSGNVSDTLSATLSIDSEKPILMNDYTAAEHNNAITAYETLEYVYCDGAVMMTTQIQEKNLDISEDVIYTLSYDDHFSHKVKNESIPLGTLITQREKFGISEITVEDRSGAEADMDESVSVIRIVFNADGIYDVSVSVKDMAGNRCVPAAACRFIIDTVRPLVRLTYYRYGHKGEEAFRAGSAAQTVYVNRQYTAMKAVAEVTEINFADGMAVAADLSMTAEDAAGRAVWRDILDDYERRALTADAWQTEEAYVQHYVMPQLTWDANYTFDFSYTDLAGNRAAITTDYITLDREEPTGSVTVSGFVNGIEDCADATSKNWMAQFAEKPTDVLFGKNGLSAVMDGTDATSGIAEIAYLYTDEFLDRNQLARRSDWNRYSGALLLSENQDVMIYQKVTDKAGNTQYYNTDRMIIDHKVPAVSLAVTPAVPAEHKGVYRADDCPGADITVTDQVVNGCSSGLKEISYRIVNGTTGEVLEGILAVFERDAYVQSWSGHVNIDPDRFCSNDVQVYVSALDWATNQAMSAPLLIKIDNQPPIVRFSMDTSDAQNGKYYKKSKILTVTVDEENFNPNVQPAVTASSDDGWSFSGWQSEGTLNTGTITFYGDGDYAVTYECRDLAGNQSPLKYQEMLTIDKTLPTVTVSYDNNHVFNGHYYQARRTALVTITEHNFHAGDVRVTATAENNNHLVKVPAPGAWVSDGDRHTAEIVYDAEGNYTFDIEYTDLAGNMMADYEPDRFTVDMTKPSVGISGVKDRSANKGIVAPVISFYDTNFSAEDIELTLTGAYRGNIRVDELIHSQNSAQGLLISFKDFPGDMDDIYILTAKAVDKAGNVQTKDMTFSVNRNGSVYRLSDAAKRATESGFTREAQDIVIEEINVDTLEFVTLTYSKDGKVILLEDGKDYTVEAEGGDHQWKKYTYTIFAECFEAEGDYTVIILSEDRARNTTTNKMKSVEIGFVVDKTAPAVSIANLKDGGRYTKDVHQFTVNVKDNTVLAYVKIFVDEQLVHEYSADELQSNDGILHIDINGSSAYQDITVLAGDAAGNETAPVTYRVLVTSSRFVQFFMNKPLAWGSFGTVIAALVCFITRIVKKSKNKKAYKR